MKNNGCLILSAGLGTRMGEAGKHLPKVLWPIFEQNILYLQICYAKSLNCQKIFINTHHQHQQIAKYVESLNDQSIQVVHEPNILDVGGAVHNVVSNYAKEGLDNLLVLNGDQFLMLESDLVTNGFSLAGNYNAILFSVWADSDENYNEIVVKNQRLVDIRKKNPKTKKYLTYSGMAIINIKNLPKLHGPSKFFDSVANYQNGNVLVKTMRSYEYWDFGTIEKYFTNIYRLWNQYLRDNFDMGPLTMERTSSSKKKSVCSFLDFFLSLNIIDQKKIDSKFQSYNAHNILKTINLSPCKVNNTSGYLSIVIDPDYKKTKRNDKKIEIDGPGVYYCHDVALYHKIL